MPKHATLEERFWEKVDRRGPIIRPEMGPCWVWTGALAGAGYGHMRFEGKAIDAHRIAFFFAEGRWPTPCALHLCDHRPCVRRSHLFEGSKGDNNRDTQAKGRGAVGERHGIHKVTASDVREIRRRYAAGGILQRELGQEFGVCQHTIWAMVRFRTWKNVD